MLIVWPVLGMRPDSKFALSLSASLWMVFAWLSFAFDPFSLASLDCWKIGLLRSNNFSDLAFTEV